MSKAQAIFFTSMLALIGATVPAWAGGPARIAITLNDNLKIQPDHITVNAGATVEFVVHNAGKLRHEFVIGSAKEVDEHAKEMQAMGGQNMDDKSMEGMQMEEKPSELVRLDVPPGKTARLKYRFRQPGTLAYACLYPGHREAGMRGIATVK